MEVKLSIVFLNYNRLNETRATTEELLLLCKNRSDIEIIAVDNGSSDGTADYLQEQSKITVILLKENTGIEGYNFGFERARGEFIMVLDDDSCPVDLSSIDYALNKLFGRPIVGLIACHIESPDGQQQLSWHLPSIKCIGPSPFFIGCGFIIRRALFEKIGWYPAGFFLYQNEIDVSFQVRLRGYEIIYDPYCRVIHRGLPNQRPGWRRVFFPTRNTLWLLRRYYPQPQLSYLIFSRLIIGLVRALYFKELNAYLRAVKEGLQEPLTKMILPLPLRRKFSPFWKQNSIFHQIFR